MILLYRSRYSSPQLYHYNCLVIEALRSFPQFNQFNVDLSVSQSTSTARYAHFILIAIAAIWAFPIIVAHFTFNLNFSTIAANLTIVALSIQFCVHNMIVNELNYLNYSRDIILHIWHFYITYCQRFLFFNFSSTTFSNFLFNSSGRFFVKSYFNLCSCSLTKFLNRIFSATYRL